MVTKGEGAFVAIIVFQERCGLVAKSSDRLRAGLTSWFCNQISHALLVGMQTRVATLEDSLPISPEVKCTLLI